MEKAKDGVTLIADAIRREMALEEQEKAKTTNNQPSNVIEVTAQFKQPIVTPETHASPPVETPNTTDDESKDDGTIYKNE